MDLGNLDKHLLIIGLGSQAKSWALNLSNSGWDITIGLRPNSPSLTAARDLGLKTLELEQAIPMAQHIALLIPDHEQLSFLKQWQSYFQNQAQIIYAHGFAPHRHQLAEKYPTLGHLLLAPKCIARELRNYYVEGRPIGGSIGPLDTLSSEQKELLFAMGKDLGLAGNLFPSNFKEECEADSFSEQALLCGLLPYGALAAFKALRKNGFSKEISFMECWLEVKLIADTMIELGPEKFFELISPNALIGAHEAQKELFGAEFENKLDKLLLNIQNGKFYQKLDGVDFSSYRKNVLDQWKNEELTQTFNELKGQLIDGI